MTTVKRAVLYDVDGTLVDTNYHHALCWFRAMRSRGITVPIWHLHRAIGMGGDRLVAHVAGDSAEKEHGDELRRRWKVEYDQLIDEVVAIEGATELLAATRDRDLVVGLASSGDPAHVEHYLELLRAKEFAQTWSTSGDVESSKPAPDLVRHAMDELAVDEAVLVGDSVWDCRAAVRAGVPCIAVRTGGFSAAELTEAGAEAVYDSLPELAEALPTLPFG
ncbi:MAG TPA: HAD family phosphatase [Pseudonocardiaceae bacterium]|jgi:HAD superfamily hydrolase (TIGR01549 family)|nr:HAD family phosphatase [Pseudonocardiaceae bacterium]